MPETIHCPQCARELRVPESLLGKKVKCPGCGTTFTAPTPAPGLPPGEGYEPVPGPAAGPTPTMEEPPAPPLPPPTGERPKEIDWMAYMALGGGALACLIPLCGCGWVIGSFWSPVKSWGWLCLLPLYIYELVVGVLTVLLGNKLRQPDAYLQPPPTVNAIMRIACILLCDWINAGLGGFTLYLIKTNPAVQAYFRGGTAPTEPAPEA